MLVTVADSQTEIERLVERLFWRALQFVFGAVLFGIVFFPLRGRGSPADIATAAALLTLSWAALRWRRPLFALVARRPAITLAFPIAPLIAVTLDGGFDSVWTPLVAMTVGVPAILGRPLLALACAVLIATGQALAAWVNRGDVSHARLVETIVFNDIGTIAAGIGISLSVATIGVFLHRRPDVIDALRERNALLSAGPDGFARIALPPAPRKPLTPAERQVLRMIAHGHPPKQTAHLLDLKESTVRSHIKSAKRKTGVRTIAELVGLYVAEDGQV